MGNRPYTDQDLRAEAASQHAALTEDPDYMGIGEAMDDDTVPSTEADGGGKTWGELLPDPDDFDTARDAIDKLIRKAADISEWAIDLGADGLQPNEHALTLGTDEKPVARIHFAFEPGMPAEERTALIHGLGQVIANSM